MFLVFPVFSLGKNETTKVEKWIEENNVKILYLCLVLLFNIMCVTSSILFCVSIIHCCYYVICC